jgi:arginine/lysine/ornithine decarboxylase
VLLLAVEETSLVLRSGAAVHANDSAKEARRPNYPQPPLVEAVERVNAKSLRIYPPAIGAMI